MANEIVTEIRLELDKFRADLKEAQEAASKTGKKAGTDIGDGLEGGLGRAAAGLKAAFLAVGTAIAGAFAIGKAVEQAAEQERAVQSLNAALALNGQFTEAASASFLKYADTLAAATTASNDAVVKGGATIAQFGKLSGQALERATAAAVDFAATGRVGLEEAFNLVAKAADGNVAALGRYGIKVRSTGDDAQDFATALKLLETRFGGLAALQTNTFSGAMAQAGNAFNELLESIGNTIVKSDTMIRLIKTITDGFGRAKKAFEEWASGRDLINEFIVALATVARAVNTYLVAPFELAFNLLKTGFDGLKTLIQVVIVSIADNVAAFTGILSPLGGKFAEVNTAVQDFAASSRATLDDFATKTAESANKVFDFNATGKAEKYIAQVEEFAATVKPVVGSAFAGISKSIVDAQAPVFNSGWEFIVNGFNAAFGKVALTSEKFKNELQTKLNSAFTSFRDGVAGSFASIGAALVKGENAFAAFGKAILGVFGDLAIQIGMFYFLMGLANLFVNPPAAAAEIAGGLALIVLGGALKALAGGGGGGGAASSTAGGGASEGGGVAAQTNLATAGPDSFNDTRRGDVGTKVEVHVAGNILDRRQTGLELAEVINEAFGNNGVAFTPGAGS